MWTENISKIGGAILIERLVSSLSAILLPAAVLIALWYPEYRYYTIEPDTITAEIVNNARLRPNEPTLSSLCNITYFFDIEPDKLQSEALRVLNGEFTLFADSTQQFDPPFHSEDLLVGIPPRRLALAAQYPATVLVSAYLETGDDSLLAAATEAICSFYVYERSTLLPKGYVRNDHATAARAALLTRFWKAYRQHDTYDSVVGELVLEQAARTTAFLARDDHFTVSTNHGVMQNLALLQLALAFPGLPSSEKNISLAIDRFDDQLAFYISDEGVVLEHSAGYHVLGVQLLGMVFQCMKLAQRPIPDSWEEKYRRALNVYVSLRRPDHSLPLIGDTDAKPELRYPQVIGEVGKEAYQLLNEQVNWPPPQPESVFGIAGYAIWWDGKRYWPIIDSLTQTVIGFSYFPGQAHKLADEMALYLWKSGTNFWTATGYWLYGGKGREYARSWQGSNAPHYSRENSPDPVTGSFGNSRTTKLIGYGYHHKGAAIDLLRTVDDLFQIRRQIVKVKDDTWIVLDTYEGLPDGIGRSVWTTSPGIVVTAGHKRGSYLLIDSTGYRMTAWFSGSDSKDVSMIRGQREPLLGWQAYDREALPTTAIVCEREPGNSWSVMVCSFDQSADRTPEVTIFDGANWTITIPADTSTTVKRTGESITIARNGDTTTLSLTSPENTASFQLRIREAFTTAQRKYQRFRSAIPTRLKISKALLFIILLQELSFFVWRRWFGRKQLALRYVSCFAWILGGSWLLGFYPIV